ncbi:LuxR C-terminal-related transcriptional regulator [Yeosuana sp. MJ-SS3]|uniref:LuxR C-terminal-related transcriptional regulator n=1 Tax=Gilvirhabdus luticola TaxID=3079858 RepID=A0ABU3U657_9FLAO|nr:LuxR C-terminal-related transcriptional regulator [Yeosuana sp. MJ-SS3]MDU8885888.1 LuxR C-terminal-related transcriptional regulator [Yeosuana sp. MJ-SS3]
MKSTFSLFLFILFVSTNIFGQYTPYFQNYSLSQYNAGNQNWGVSVANNGKIYVANNNGLLEFDGFKWEFFQLPNKTIIRSVLAHQGLIYTGSYEEFGYWEKNRKGELIYTSLSDLLVEKVSLNEEFWQILHFKDSIIFRSFSNVYVYKNGEVVKIYKQSPTPTVISCNISGNKFYVSTLKNGVFVLEDTNLTPVINDPFVIDKRMISIIEYKGDLLISTALNGSFIYKNNSFMPWDSEINELIKEHQFNSFSLLKNGTMVFGTIKNGIYITDYEGNIKYHINKENGLINNTILSHVLDDENTKLWVGLDNGVAYIDLNSHHTFYNDYSGKLGAVYDIILYNNTIYIGSNTGLFYINNNDDLQFVEGSQGQVWDLTEINGELLCGHNNGTFIVKETNLEKISNFTGGWTLKKQPEKMNSFYQGTYAGLVNFKNSGNKWVASHAGETTIPIKYLEFEDQHTIWVAHAYKGVFKISLDKESGKVKEVKDYQNKGLWSNYSVRVHKIKNDICFKTNNGWQKYEPLLDSIVPHNLLNKNFGNDANLISESDSDLIGIKDSKNQINFKSLTNEDYNLTLTSNFFKNRLIVGSEKITKINDSLFALALYDGFMVIDSKNYYEKEVLIEPVIDKISINNELINLDTLKVIESPYNKNVSISVSSPKSNGHFFEYSISNLDSIHWFRMDTDKLDVSNLNDGNYTIRFRAANSSGDTSPSKVINLKILPPWYESEKGALLYLIVILAVSILIFTLHKRKISKEQQLLEQRFQREQEEILKQKNIENEKKIMQLKTESLENEVKLKSKQLANTAMALVNKNESMLEIKNELLQNKDSFGNYWSFKKLLKKVDNSIGHQDEWEVFEYNFNQVHEEFFNQLKSDYPHLTHKDLKICAYIKMNLLTKEIAPLMNISVRGVETHRYRLKRKLNLENDKSLTDFLRNIK